MTKHPSPNQTLNAFPMHQIGLIHSPFPEKFGIPRQSGLIEGNDGWIELQAPWNRQEALQGLEGFSHIWVVFVFHEAIKPVEQWRPTVRPPREGAKRQGVFATRSPYRPNPIGMSVLAYQGWEKRNGKLMLKVSGLDLLDQTPVLDIKPYLPYADALTNAHGGFAATPPDESVLPIEFSQQAQDTLKENQSHYPNLEKLITSTVKHDIRPVHFGNIQARKEFGLKLYQFDIQWKLEGDKIFVTSIKTLKNQRET